MEYFFCSKPIGRQSRKTPAVVYEEAPEEGRGRDQNIIKDAGDSSAGGLRAAAVEPARQDAPGLPAFRVGPGEKVPECFWQYLETITAGDHSDQGHKGF